MNITGLIARRSLGRTAFPAFLALAVLNTLLRSMTWRHEWMWAVYQYNFTVMLLGPLLAGIAGWEGYRLAKAQEFLLSHRRPIALLATATAALWAWCAAAFLLGLIMVGGIVAGSGTPWQVGVQELVTPVPALLLLLAECAAGVVAGWLSGSKLAPPLAAITVFLATLLLYAGNLSAFVMVGGATSSLVGLAPKMATQTWQSLFFVLTAALVILAGTWLATWYRTPRWPVMGAAVLATAAVAVQLATVSPIYLERREGDVVCHGASPQICLGRSYQHFEPHLRQALSPFIHAIDKIGFQAPVSYRQDAHISQPGTAQLGLDTVTGNKELLADMILGTYYGPDCTIEPQSQMEKNYTNARYYLAQAAGIPSDNDDPTLDPRLVRGSAHERTMVAHQAFAGLIACRG
ncbi:hypothetical protein ACWD11_34285 [Streptomyces sp. NPDC002776]